ncbi:YcsC protein [Paraburkholderia tropica]
MIKAIAYPGTVITYSSAHLRHTAAFPCDRCTCAEPDHKNASSRVLPNQVLNDDFSCFQPFKFCKLFVCGFFLLRSVNFTTTEQVRCHHIISSHFDQAGDFFHMAVYTVYFVCENDERFLGHNGLLLYFFHYILSFSFRLIYNGQKKEK